METSSTIDRKFAVLDNISQFVNTDETLLTLLSDLHNYLPDLPLEIYDTRELEIYRNAVVQTAGFGLEVGEVIDASLTATGPDDIMVSYLDEFAYLSLDESIEADMIPCVAAIRLDLGENLYLVYNMLGKKATGAHLLRYDNTKDDNEAFEPMPFDKAFTPHIELALFVGRSHNTE